jgi:hypothetical protein
MDIQILRYKLFLVLKIQFYSNFWRLKWIFSSISSFKMFCETQCCYCYSIKNHRDSRNLQEFLNLTITLVSKHPLLTEFSKFQITIWDFISTLSFRNSFHQWMEFLKVKFIYRIKSFSEKLRFKTNTRNTKC